MQRITSLKTKTKPWKFGDGEKVGSQRRCSSYLFRQETWSCVSCRFYSRVNVNITFWKWGRMFGIEKNEKNNTLYIYISQIWNIFFQTLVLVGWPDTSDGTFSKSFGLISCSHLLSIWKGGDKTWNMTGWTFCLSIQSGKIEAKNMLSTEKSLCSMFFLKCKNAPQILIKLPLLQHLS